MMRTLRESGRPHPSLRKIRLFGMTMKLSHYRLQASIALVKSTLYY